jgi:hypothetical protein
VLGHPEDGALGEVDGTAHVVGQGVAQLHDVAARSDETPREGVLLDATPSVRQEPSALGVLQTLRQEQPVPSANA